MSRRTARERTAPGSLEAVLDHAWTAGEFTTADAMERTGLTRSTTIEALDRLIALGLLNELPNAREAGEYRKGRPSRRFDLRADAAFVIGVDAGRMHLTAMVADLRGHTRGQASTVTDNRRDDPVARIEQIDQVISDALADAAVQQRAVMAICLGVPAAVDANGDSPQHRQGFWELMNPGLRTVFADRVPIVRVENDAALAAVAEGAVGAAATMDTYVALLAGERLGIGVLHAGQLLRGARGAAGEAHSLRWVAGVEHEAGLGALLASWALADVAAGKVQPPHPLAGADAEQVTAPVVLALAAAGDAWAVALVDRAATVLARICAVLATMYDPEIVVVCGAAAAGLGTVVEQANEHIVTDLSGPAPTIVASGLGAEVVAVGAVMGAVEAARAGALQLALRRSRSTASRV